jgi:hypothetical protein
MIESVVFQARAGAIHRRGGGGDDVNDGGFGGHEPWAEGRLASRILRHQGIRITLLPQQNGHHTCAHNDAAAANSNEQIGRGSARRGRGALHCRPGGILVHGIKNSSIERTELRLQALQEIGALCDGLSTDHESTLRLVPTHLISEVL